MAIPARPIGQGPEAELLWNISKQLEALIGVVYTSANTPYLSNVLEYTDNADAISNGLTAGYVYRTGDNLKIVH